MSHHYLEKLFSPRSIAVIGASDRVNSVGMKVFKNLLQADFSGRIFAVNLKHDQVQGRPCFSSVKNIEEAVDLAVIATPAGTIPDILKDCGEKGVRSAIVLSSGFSEIGKEGKALEKAMLDAAKHYKIRIMGPNCLGLMRPHINMNATFDKNFALPGSIALVSQSGALSVGILDWAMNRGIGFSTIASLGNNSDIDFGDVLNYLALDPYTKSILLYIEGVRNSRHFMSALRAAARMKPVIAIKAGKNSQGSRAALSHTGALIGSDDVFDAALRRAGAIRVMKIEDLFAASEILSISKKISGNRLAIITNGGGAGVMAADRASELGVVLPSLDENIIHQLNDVLPKHWSHQNPIDVIGDATPERYHATLNICKKEKNIDGILTMLVPVAMSHPLKVAKQVIRDAQHIDKAMLVCWMGEKQVRSSWKLFSKHKIPCFDTPEKAIEAFSYLAKYKENQQLLMQVPTAISTRSHPDVTEARTIIESVLANGRNTLTGIESASILKTFGIPIAEIISADTAEAAALAAQKIGFPVVIKINSPDISHKSDVGGVCLNLMTEQAVSDAFHKMIANIKQDLPEARILGVTVEKQEKNANNREVMIGVKHDKVFGPVISFGMGGVLVEVIKDRVLALPPLNRFMAHQLISETRAAKLLGKFRHMPAVQIENLVDVLMSVSEMLCELPYIQEMDINPLLINENRIVAVDARIVVADIPKSFVRYSHLAIHPYPNYLISSCQLKDGTTVTIRPIRPEDAELEQEFTRQLSQQSKYFRFMESFQQLSPMMLVRLTQIDYDNEMALVATYQSEGREKMIGVVRYSIKSDNETAEFSLVVADSWHHKGVGTKLMHQISGIAKSKDVKTLVGTVLAINSEMLRLVQHLGFHVSSSEDPTIKIVTKIL